MGDAGRLLQIRIDHGVVGTSVAVGSSVAVGICVAALIGSSVGVSEHEQGTGLPASVQVGITSKGTVCKGASGAQGGTWSICPVCRRVEVPMQLARWSSATVIP